MSCHPNSVGRKAITLTHVRRRDVLLGLATGAVARPSFGAAAVQTEPPARGPLSIAEVGALLTGTVPGASIAIIDGGELIATYGYGMAQADRPVSPQTRLQAASISKTVNALAVLKLAQAGRIGLDDPVNRHLTSWKLPDNALTSARAVTVRMLLSHTGGTSVSGFWGYLRTDPLPTLREILDGQPPANSAAVRVLTTPGKAYQYSGGGTTVLQQMVMDVTGEAYPAALQRLVLAPLAMNESSYVQPPEDSTLQLAAFGYGKDGSLVQGGFRLHPEMAAAGLWTTPRDLSRMVLAIMRSAAGKADAFLDRGLAGQMLTPVIGQSGLGTFIDSRGAFSHPGSNVGFRSLYAGDPKTAKGMVAMTNSDNGEKVCAALRQRVTAAYGWR